jgi:hypothetical protein
MARWEHLHPYLNWPLVDPRDDGIRPAGPPDECLYCRQKVGKPHGAECVIVKKRVELRVLLGDEELGLWQCDEPFFWDQHMTWFDKNESSWCMDNFIDERDKRSTSLLDKSWNHLETLVNNTNDDTRGCLCNSGLRFEFVRVVDKTPRRALQPPPDAPDAPSRQRWGVRHP